MGQNLTNIENALKDFYGPTVVPLLNNKTKLLDQFTKNGDKGLSVDGRQVLYPIHDGRNVGVGAVGENKTLPVAGNQATAQVKIPYRYNYGRIELTKQAIEASKTNKGAFKKAMELEMKNLIVDMARSRNRQLWGFGTGILCRVSGNQADSTSIVVKDAYGVPGTLAPARLLQVGDVVAFVRNATPTSATDSDIVGSSNIVAVSSISADLSTITFDQTTGATLNDNDMIVMAPADTAGESSVNREVMGLLGIVDDGTYVGTLFNIPRTTHPKYKGTVLNANSSLNFNLLQRAEDLTDERGGAVKTLFSHHSIRREYMQLLMVAKRFVGEDVARPDPGFAGSGLTEDVKWNGKPWKADRSCPFGMLFAIDPSENVRYVNTEGEWADDDGTVLMRVANKDSYEARYRVFDNFHNERPCTNFRLDKINLTLPFDVAAYE